LTVHFIAIGGSVMHQLALALKKKGYSVSGSDDEIFEPARTNLTLEGLLPPQVGWFPDKIHPGLDAIILGMHAKADNPELIKAKDLGLSIYSFPGYIYQESRDKTRVVVGGSHGKTTTTAMIMHVLKKGGYDIDWMVGAKLEGFSQSVNITKAPIIICEGDEYPASALEKIPKFHLLFPHIAIITGIAWDHINIFPSFELYLEQFSIFMDKIVPGGILIYNDTDETLKKLINKHKPNCRKKAYGIPNHRIEDGKTIIEVNGIQTELHIFGNHNLLNLHAACLACEELGMDNQTFLDASADFSGASKRLELMARNEYTNVYRDFAHAPSKVKATIEAVKEQFPARRLISVLELHTYSSLNPNFLSEYKGTLAQSDEVVVFYSRHALELKRMPELAKEKVLAGFAKDGLVVLQDKDELKDWLETRMFKQANLLLMSSGNFDGLDMITFAKKITK
jgi:UDP-N-acetylmuramate: L-alanyl-gamma-D-glutamyl-meso-diaminopimelate ligase